MIQKKKEVLVAVIGAGGVGAHFLSQLAWISKQPATSHIKLCYLGIIDRVFWTADYSPIDIDQALSILEKEGQEPIPLQQSIDYFAAAPSKMVVVDNTSAQGIAEAYPRMLRQGINIITPNKKAFSGSYQLWEDVYAAAEAGKSTVYNECSVGAALPVLSTLRSLLSAGDQITRIEGVFSGTMSYLFSTFSPTEHSESAEEWSTIVRKARQLGYTEPDPRDDLVGLDVARKLTILARMIGLKVESATSFPVESLVPKALEGCSTADDFLSRLPDHDDEMKQRKMAAAKEGKVLRFVGSVDAASGQLNVGVQALPRTHAISQLSGSDNIISFYTKTYGERPLIIQGAGAGGEVTAMGVLIDLLKVVGRLG